MASFFSDNLLNQTHPSFRFVIEIEGEAQGAFTECTLPVIEWEIESIKEGGLNEYVHQLPGMRKSSRVTLKNGVGRSMMADWYLSTISDSISRKPITIILLDVEHTPVLVWNIKDAYPIKWTGPQLKADSNAIAIQSVELACGEVTLS